MTRVSAICPCCERSDEKSGKPYQYFREIRGFVIWLLQYRAYPLWKRLVILGSLCDQLHEMAVAGGDAQPPEVLEAYREAVQSDRFGEALKPHYPRPAEQLQLILELIVGRISSDFTGPRLLACYQKFMQGMDWTAESSMTDIGRRYAAAHSEYYWPYMSQHQHILEHYLVNYVHRKLFPLGPQESTRGLSIHHAANTIRDQCFLMMVHYGIVQTLLIGMAAFHKDQFGTAEVIQVIQSFTKAFEHSLSFPERALKVSGQPGREELRQPGDSHTERGLLSAGLRGNPAGTLCVVPVSADLNIASITAALAIISAVEIG